MTEIEIKAHVKDPNFTESKIRSFAQFIKKVTKSDVYWKQETTGLKVRLRTEQISEKESKSKMSKTIITYKKKKFAIKLKLMKNMSLVLQRDRLLKYSCMILSLHPILKKQRKH